LASIKLVILSVAKDLAAAKFWSILADETQDRAKREQLVIVVRYVLKNVPQDEHVIAEEPIRLIDLFQDIKTERDADDHTEVKLSGNAIGETLIRAADSLGLNSKHLVGQGYHGAAAMASERICAAAALKKVSEHADYFHCVMHSLNLSATQAVKVSEIRQCQDILTEMCNFLKYAKRQSHWRK
jgi:hypothetical protein